MVARVSAPSVPSASLLTSISNEPHLLGVRETLNVSLIDTPLSWQRPSSSLFLKGQVRAATPEGTAVIATPEGDITIQMPEGTRLTAGQRVSLSIPAKDQTSAQPSVTGALPESESPPPASSPPAPPASRADQTKDAVVIRQDPAAAHAPTALDDQLRTVAVTRGDTAMPAGPALQTDEATMITPRPVSLAYVLQNMSGALPASAASVAELMSMPPTVAFLASHSVAITQLTMGSLPSPVAEGLAGMAALPPDGLSSTTPRLPLPALAAPQLQTDGLALPDLWSWLSPTAAAASMGHTTDPLIENTLLMWSAKTSLSLLSPGTGEQIASSSHLAFDIAAALTAQNDPAAATQPHSYARTFVFMGGNAAGSASFWAAAPSAPQNQVTFYMLPFMPSDTRAGDVFYTAPIPTATPPARGMAPSLPPAPSTPAALFADALMDMLDGIGRLDPSLIAHLYGPGAPRVAVPTPQSPQNMGPMTLFFLAALRAGDLQSFLGERLIDTLRRAGKGGLIDKLSDAFSSLRQSADTSAAGDYRSYAIPLQFQQDIKMIHLHVKGDGSKDGSGQDKGAGTRFILDVDFDRMGAVQMDMLYRPGHLDTILRTEWPLSHAMRGVLEQKYAASMGHVNHTGLLIFQNDLSKWVTIRATPDHMHVRV